MTLEKKIFMKLNSEQNKGIFNGVFLGYFVLLMHVLLILVLGVVVVLIKGIYDFRWFLFAGGAIFVLGSGYFFYRKLKESNRSLREAINDPALQGKTLEISLFGGMASVKLGSNNDQPQLIHLAEGNAPALLEAPRSQVQELSDLAKMLEDDLISREEFGRLKKQLIES